MRKIVPVTTQNRYPQYLRVLRAFESKGIKKIMSHSIATEMRVESSTVRKDFSFLGNLGRQGYGYRVDELIEVFSKELGEGKDENIVLIGVGNMGKALLKYNFFENKIGKIICAFDIDPLKIGTIGDVPVYHINDLKNRFPIGVKIAILANSSENLQMVVDDLSYLGVRAFINFTDGTIKQKRKMMIHNIDLIAMIQDVVYQFKLGN